MAATQVLSFQAALVVTAAPGSLTGRYPAGNTGGARVSALAPMPIPEDLATYLSPTSQHQEQS